MRSTCTEQRAEHTRRAGLAGKQGQHQHRPRKACHLRSWTRHCLCAAPASVSQCQRRSSAQPAEFDLNRLRQGMSSQHTAQRRSPKKCILQRQGAVSPGPSIQSQACCGHGQLGLGEHAMERKEWAQTQMPQGTSRADWRCAHCV